MVHKRARAHHVVQHDSKDFILLDLDLGVFEVLPLYLLIPEAVVIIRGG